MAKKINSNNTLNLIETIYNALNMSALKSSALTKCENPSIELSNILGLSKDEAMMFAIAFSLSSDNSNINIHNVSSLLKINSVSTTQFIGIFDSLFDKGWLDINTTTLSEIGFDYVIPLNIFNAICNNTLGELQKGENKIQLPDFFNSVDTILNDIFQSNSFDIGDKPQLMRRLASLIKRASHLPFVQECLVETKFPILDSAFFLYVSSKALNEDNVLLKKVIKVLSNNPFESAKLEGSFITGKNTMIKKKFVIMVPSEYKNSMMVGLHPAIIKKYFDELIKPNNEDSFAPMNCKIIYPTDLAIKKMHFDDYLSAQIHKIQCLLTNDKYDMVVRKLKQSNQISGISILLHGKPGTGKTETVLQLAKETNRRIIRVDFGMIKDAYVGESEKNLRRIFTDYKHACSIFKQTPILLFNESDALINSRITETKSSVDTMNNTMQNILLQELEEFDGIFIATTNLISRLDQAFERRFLFKVAFKQPTVMAQVNIWKSKFETLNDAQLQAFVKRYDFSGAQIENIYRKYLIDNLIFDTQISDSYLHELCGSEKLNNTHRKSIGFIE